MAESESAFERGAVFGQCQSPLHMPARHNGINDVFQLRHPGGQAIGVIIGKHRHAGLQYGGSAIQLRRDEMHRRTRFRVAPDISADAEIVAGPAQDDHPRVALGHFSHPLVDA